MNEKRKVYRQRELPDEIEIYIAWPEHDYVKGGIVDLSSKGAAISLPLADSEPPAIEVGTSVILRIVIPGQDPLKDISAICRNERDDDKNRVFGLEIIDWRKLERQLPPQYFSNFNRRRHYRLDVSRQSIDVEVSPLNGGGVFTAALQNISIGGCLLQCRIEPDAEVGAEIRLKFSLGSPSAGFDLMGTIEAKFDIEGGTGYGIQFKDRDSQAFRVQEQQISLFIMEQQRAQRESR